MARRKRDRLRTGWCWGDKRRLAFMAGITPGYLSDILAGRKSPRVATARRLSSAGAALGYELSPADMLLPLESDNPLVARGEDDVA